jgi:hypothetical protein
MNQKDGIKFNRERRSVSVDNESLVASCFGPTAQFTSPFVRDLAKQTAINVHKLYLSTWTTQPFTRKVVSGVEHIIELFEFLDDAQAVKCVKYLISVDLPRLVGDVEPERPCFLAEGATLFTGAYRIVDKTLRRRRGTHHGGVSKVDDKQLRLAFSIMNMKKDMPCLSPTLKKESLRGLKKRLSAKAMTPERLIREVERTADELFPEGWDTEGRSANRVPNFTLPNKSCVESSINAGGVQGYHFARSCNVDGDCHIRGLHLLSTVPRIARDRGFRNQELKDLYDVDIDPHIQYTSHATCLELATELSLKSERFTAQAEIVDDPLKARVITKNEWFCGFLKPLQKMLHSRLRMHPAFRLLGEGLSEELLDETFGLGLPKGCRWVSGDYEAATDNFKSDCSDAALRVVLSNMRGKLSKDQDYLIMAMKSLYDLQIWISPASLKQMGLRLGKNLTEAEYDELVGLFNMERGQLMGSLLSFPFLCLINFAIWRHATELTVRERCDGTGSGGERDHVLINGDDILFAANPTQYNLWYSLVPQVGLSPSAGKNYFTERFLTVNTQLYAVRDGGGFKRLHHLNFGLLKVKEESVIDQLGSIGRMFDEFVEGAINPGGAAGVFIQSHQGLLKLTTRNLYGPRALGGLGAHPVKGTRGTHEDGYLWRQLVIAEACRRGTIRFPGMTRIERYLEYQRHLLSKKFPDAVRCQSTELSSVAAKCDRQWFEYMNIDESYEGCENGIRSAVAWMAKYEKKSEYDAKRELRTVLKTVKSLSSAKHKIVAMSVEDYLNYESREYHWFSPCSVMPWADEVESLFS